MVLWTLMLLIVLKVNKINFGLIKMFYISGKPTLLVPGTEVYVRYNVLLKFTLSLTIVGHFPPRTIPPGGNLGYFPPDISPTGVGHFPPI